MESIKRKIMKQNKADILFEIRLNQIESNEQSKLAYDNLYAKSNISQTHSFYLWLLDLLDLKTEETYLDVSCGQGQLANLALKQGALVHGLDLSYTALQFNTGPHFVTGNSQQLPYAGSKFDVISNIGSLEHYVNMTKALREMVRVLKPNGRTIILVPNSFSLLHNIWIAFRDGRTNIDKQPIQRYATRLEWQALLEDNGLVVDKTIKYEIERPRTRADWWRYLRHPKKMLRLVLSPFIPLNFAFCFVYFCHKPRPNQS